MICDNCGKTFEGNFCPYCGQKVPGEAAETQFCPQCGKPICKNDMFCGNCGAMCQQAEKRGSLTKDQITHKIKDTLYDWAGENDDVKIKLSDLVSNVFKRHTKEEAESIFISGTKYTTPPTDQINTSWPHPWLYSRVLMAFGIAYALLYFCCKLFNNVNSLPGFLIVGSFAVPLACLIFFFEVNAPQNISFYKMIEYFLIGGCASLLFTLALYSFVDMNVSTYWEAILVSVIEEFGKIAVVAVIIFMNKNTYRLNGIVIGAAIGAGFAAMESAGYAFCQFFASGFDGMVDVIFLRAFLAPGGHVVWAAISGYAVVLAIGEGGNYSFPTVFSSVKFWRLFAIPFVCHAVWDMPIRISDSIPALQIVLTVVSWIVILILISAGLKQTQLISKTAAEKNKEAPSEE